MDLPGKQSSFKFLLLRKKTEQGVLVVKEIRDCKFTPIKRNLKIKCQEPKTECPHHRVFPPNYIRTTPQSLPTQLNNSLYYSDTSSWLLNPKPGIPNSNVTCSSNVNRISSYETLKLKPLPSL